ncbi:MAG: cation:proton antiporter [Xanthomonadales bacterium]|nr:cation:proton antiporter [Xanthomonadales bacterium]
MPEESIVFTLFLIFTGAAFMATLALYARQALIIGYIVLGVLFGPWGLGWVSDTRLIADMAHVGIIFLLFLLGLNLTPQKLRLLFKQTLLVTFASALVFFAAGWGIARLFGFSEFESLLVGAASMFSSTIVGIKLLPTTVLHHRHMGEIMISVLLLQDLIAIVVMLVLQSPDASGVSVLEIGWLIAALPLLIAVALILERWALLPLFRRFDRVIEYVFLLTLAWCLGIAELAEAMGLSYEIGAFIAGIAIATSPIALYIAESLKPLRDFFLVMFFFAIGASLNLEVAVTVMVPAAVLAAAMLVVKPLVFRGLLGSVAESPKLAWESGFRLGQMSEFSLLITFIAIETARVGGEAVYMIQLATLITFIVSSSLVVLRFPTPVAANEKLRRD